MLPSKLCLGMVLSLSLLFPSAVLAASPSFGSETIPDQNYVQNTEITLAMPVQLPEATGGKAPFRYSIVVFKSPDSGGFVLLDDLIGLSFDAGTRVLSGTPTDAGIFSFFYTATDADGDTAVLTFNIVIYTSDSTEETVTATVTGFGSGEDNKITLRSSGRGVMLGRYFIIGYPDDDTPDLVNVPPGESKQTNEKIINSAGSDGFALLQDRSGKAIVADIKVEDPTVACTPTCQIAFPYTQDNLDSLKIEEDRLIVLHYNDDTFVWEMLEEVTASRTLLSAGTGGVITVGIESFSSFALGASIRGGEATQLNEEILTRFTHIAVANVASAVERRMDAAFSAPQGASYQLDGQTDDQSRLSANLQDTLQRKLPGYLKSLKDDTMDWKQMMSNSSFVLPLNATNDGVSADFGLTIWGSGDYTTLSGKGAKGTNVDWKGDVFGIQLGADKRVRDDVLFGGLVSWSKGDVDYTQNSVKGDYKHTLTSVHPYMAWSNDVVNLWGNVGYGQGKLEIEQTGSDTHSRDTKLLSLTAGVKGQLSAGVSLKSDITLMRTRIDRSVGIVAETLASQQFRLIVKSERQRTLALGGTVTPVLEVGVRYDGGDGDTGVGAVLGAGVRYANTSGLTVEGKVDTLLGRKDYKEWGVQGTIHQQARANGQGLSFSLSPRYGDTGSNTNQVWQGILDGNSTDDYSARLNVNMRYGVFAPGGRGLLTPYSEITLGNAKHYRLGITWKPDALFDIHLSGEREESSTIKHRVLLESTIRF